MAAWQYIIFIIWLLATTFCDCCSNVTSLELYNTFCASLSNGFYEYPYDCSAYISCSDSCAELEYCPDGKLYNSSMHICDTPEAVECSPLPYPKDPCQGEMNNTILPSASSCDEFFVCVNGQSEVYRCPGEMLFNPDLGICDYKDNVWCYGDRTTQDGQGTTPTTEEPFTECVGQKLGALFPDIRNCQQYYYCWGNDSFSIFPCPVDNWFNPNSGNCGPDISPEACRQVVTTTKTTTTPLTTVGTATTIGKKENPCEDQELGATFPLQSDCQQYLLCLGGGQSATVKCPVNAWFDPDTGDCGPNVSPTACLDAFSTSTTVTTTQSSDDLCANQELGVSYPLVTNCQQYILCMGNGESTVANCIYNAWFDPQTGICGPEVSPTACKESGSTTESSTSKATTPSTTASPTVSTTTSLETTTSPSDISGICFGQSEDYYASYPEDCSKYIVCARPVPIAFYCPPSLFFNELLQKCVEWEASDCSKEETTTASPGLTTPAPDASVCFNNSGHNLPYLQNCQWFIRCVDDSSYMMGICSTGEFFDPLTGECGPNVSPDACREVYTTTTTPVTDTTESSTAVITPTSPSAETDPCEGVPDGKLVPYPNDCTKFIACVQPYPLVYDCQVGQEFSAVLQRCMAPWYANCSIIVTTTHAPSTSTTVSEETPLPDSFCGDKSEGSLVPYPYNCSKYIVCQDPIPVGYACPENEEFSPLELICMDAQLAGCNPKGFSLHSPDHGFFHQLIASFGIDF